MAGDDFRREAHAFADWMADYLDAVGGYPVRAQVAPGDIAARLAPAAPEAGEPIEAIFADFRRDLLPGMTHWQHPRFFAYFPANSSPPSVLAEMLTATLGAQCMSWQTSPAATELETRVMAWLRDLLGLPAGFEGSIQDTASAATLAAVLTARERATGWQAGENGLAGLGALTAYASEEAHSSIDKAVRIAGLGVRNLRKVPVDGAFAMDPAALEQAIARDLADGARPVCVIATTGTTGVGACDPLRPIGEVCRRHGVWLHVDAAWAGSALVLPEERAMADGLELADSFVFNPHKWLFTNFDCSAYYVRDRAALLRTFEILPEYLKTREAGEVVNYRDWGIPLGRRFRALKLWFVLRHYGAEGLRARIAAHIAWARELADEVAAEPGFECLTPANLALFCFRCRPPGLDDPGALDALNQALLERINDSGKAYLTHTRVRGAYAIRFVVGQTSTTRADVQAAWELVRETAAALLEDRAAWT